MAYVAWELGHCFMGSGFGDMQKCACSCEHIFGTHRVGTRVAANVRFQRFFASKPRCSSPQNPKLEKKPSNPNPQTLNTLPMPNNTPKVLKPRSPLPTEPQSLMPVLNPLHDTCWGLTIRKAPKLMVGLRFRV